MQRKITSILCALLIASLSASTAQAGGSVGFGLGSLIADGTLWGFGNGDTVTLTGTGPALVMCVSPGGNAAPGQNRPLVTASGDASLGGDSTKKNGKSAVYVVAEPGSVSPEAAGCPNGNWRTQVVFVYYTTATITVYAADGSVNLIREYTCVTTANSATPQNTADGTIICTLVSESH